MNVVIAAVIETISVQSIQDFRAVRFALMWETLTSARWVAAHVAKDSGIALELARNFGLEAFRQLPIAVALE